MINWHVEICIFKQSFYLTDTAPSPQATWNHARRLLWTSMTLSMAVSNELQRRKYPLGLSLCVLAIFVEAEWVNLRCCCKPQILASEGIFVRHQIWLHHTYPAHWRSTVTVSTDWTHYYTQHAVHYNIFWVESLVFWFHRCSPLKQFCEWQQAPCQRAWRYNNFKTMTHFTLITRLRWIYWWHIPWSIHCKLIEDLVPVYRIDLHRLFKFDAESSKWWKATYRLSSTKWLL